MIGNPVTGRSYRLRGRVVTVTCAWSGRTSDLPAPRFPHVRTRPTAPRNVQLQHADGHREIRPFRGLTRVSLPGT